MSDTALRGQLAKLLDWDDAHASFDTAVEGIPSKLRGVVPTGLPYSAWQLLEHLRLAQHDILDFCRNPAYREMHWPDDYWPASAAPAKSADWDRSVAQFRTDRAALQALAADTKIDLFARIPHGSGQTYLRELLLVADHTAYHIGQLVAVRRALGAWKAG
jgi:uncharacterized damage-inducible protein DinB